ncbi:alanine racemase [Sphingomonas sp. PB2P19]|uniref:alanine racemase n=1 Tax=Sphingomonas rhamnosi TaxID=3096156 RepID=UPI002FC63143
MTERTADRAAMTRLTIDLAAIVRNYRRIAALAPNSTVAAVVKADAYGIGAARVAAALAAAGCRHFFVAHLSEVAAVRAAAPAGTPIYVLNGLVAGAEADCAALGAIPVLNSLAQLAAWRAQGPGLPAIVQVDSGMQRLGLSADEIGQLATAPALLDGIDLRYVMSHLACADEPDSPANARQRERFASICAELPLSPRSLANSGGAFLGADYHFDLLRPGIALYGGSPRPGVTMDPVVSLSAAIIQTRVVPAGTGIGYGLTAAADHPRVIATIGVGYADGWPRRLGGRGSAFVGDTRVPIVGRISMDSLLIDVSAIPDEARQAGAAVELLGPHQTIDDVARDADTISYEILTQLGARYARHYVGDGAPHQRELA